MTYSLADLEANTLPQSQAKEVDDPATEGVTLRFLWLEDGASGRAGSPKFVRSNTLYVFCARRESVDTFVAGKGIGVRVRRAKTGSA